MLRRTIFFLIYFLVARNTYAQVPPTRAEIIAQYIETYREVAIAEMQRTGVPASIKLAQGILETEAGKSDLVRRSNNHFGIKCKSNWTGDKVYHDDDAKGECFRAYPSAIDSWRDHSDYLKSAPWYASLFKLDGDDYKGWAYGLKAAGYATNPKYPQLLIKYIEDFNLNDYSLIAMGKKRAPDWAPSKNIISSPSQVAKGNVIVAASTKETSAPNHVVKKKNYPAGVFKINETKVIYAAEGSSIKNIAEANGISAAYLYEFNELRDDEDILKAGKLVYLQRKRTVGENEFYIVEEEEDMYEISQRLGIRLESILQYNQMTMNMKPAIGETIYLQKGRSSKPKLLNSK
ncbi:MAG: glycoside hydrolase family 73 protein [Sphingobacteriales bacterium]|jgi:LysM repeat protein